MGAHPPPGPAMLAPDLEVIPWSATQLGRGQGPGYNGPVVGRMLGKGRDSRPVGYSGYLSEAP